jgi:NAD(P)-dependent dehydrogenase (short-subunit alcohol dehydrogenase family)
VDLGLRGKTALVTGGSSGIGLATVELMLAEGMNVFALARDPARLERELGALSPEDGSTLGWASCDVLDAPAVGAAVEQAFRQAGSVDVLVCNAGQGRQTPFAETTVADWRAELDLKFMSVLHPLHAALPHLRKAEGSVIVVNAVLARQPEPTMTATSAARAGILNLARSLARELAPEVRVNSILLGLIRSGQWHRRWVAANSGEDEETWSAGVARSRQIPLGRLGTPEEAAAAITFLASPRASYITGATVEVDGGVARYA